MAGGGASAAGGAAVTVPRLKLAYEEDIRDTVTSVAPLVVKEGWVPSGGPAPGAPVPVPGGGGGGTSRLARHVVVGTPRRLQVHEWHQGKLRMISFHHAANWISDIVTINDYIIYGDAHTSVRFLKWRDDDHQLIPIAGDGFPVDVAAVGAIVHDATLGLVVADADANLQVFAYAPVEHRTRLMLRADMHLGAVADRLARSRLAFPVGTPSSARRSYGAFFGTYAGSIGAVQPLDEMTFRRLLALQRVLTHCLPHAAGLNPREWRAYAAPRGGGRPRARNFLDSALLWRYLTLSTHTQAAFADAIGSSPDRILANLRAADAAGAVF